MNYKTHVIGGVGTGLILTQTVMTSIYGDLPLTGEILPTINIAVMSVAMVVGSVTGSVFPDVDKKNSFIGNKLKVTSSILSSMFKHRGLIHTPLFYAGFLTLLFQITNWLLSGYICTLVNCFLIGFSFGVLSHLLLDSLTKHGIMWLFPLTKRNFKIIGITTGSVGELIISALMCIGFVAFLINSAV